MKPRSATTDKQRALIQCDNNAQSIPFHVCLRRSHVNVLTIIKTVQTILYNLNLSFKKTLANIIVGSALVSIIDMASPRRMNEIAIIQVP